MKNLDKGWQQLSMAIDNFGQGDVQNQKPRAAIASLNKDTREGQPVWETPQRGALLSRLESRRSSLPNIKSALKAWHTFAVCTLGFTTLLSTIPPVESLHVQMFGETFRNMHTASNYITDIVWDCRMVGSYLDWMDEQLTLWLKGARKRELQAGVLRRPCAFLLTELLVQQLVTFCDALEMFDVSVLILVCWYFPLRVQSEAFLLVHGCAGDANELPRGVEASIWTSNGWAHVVFKKRKLRP